MTFPDGNYYVEVKHKRYRIHLTENTILRKRDPALFSELNIKFKTKLILGIIKKLLPIKIMN